MIEDLPPELQEPSIETKQEPVSYRAYHMILDCSNCNVKTFDKENFYPFLRDVAESIGVLHYGPPVSAHMDSGDSKTTGWFIQQLLEGVTAVSGNFITDSGEAYIDVVSVVPFDPEKIEMLVRKYFQPGTTKNAFLARQA